MGFVTLEDQGGQVDCVFFSDPYTSSQRVLDAEQPILIRGKIEKSNGEGNDACKIIAESAELLSVVREQRTRVVHLMLSEEELASKLDALTGLLRASPGNCPVHLHLNVQDLGWVRLAVGEELQVIPDDPLVQGLEELFQRPDVARMM